MRALTLITAVLAAPGLMLSALPTAAAPMPAVSPPTYTAQIFNPGGVAPMAPNASVLTADGSTLYVSDQGGRRIVKIDVATNALTEVSAASNGWGHPSGLFLEPDQVHLWVADKDHSRIVQIDVTTGAFTRVVGSGANLTNPEDMLLDSAGIYVNDTYGHRVVKFNLTTGSILWTTTTCAGMAVQRNRGLTFGTDGNLYVTDTDNGRILVINPATGVCLRAFGSGGRGPGHFAAPRGIDSDGAGGLWVAENGNFRIQHVGQDGSFMWLSPTTFGSGPGQFRTPHGVQVIGGKIYVSDTYNYRLAVFTPGTGGSAVFDHYVTEPPPAPGGFNGPMYLEYDPTGNLYVVDHFNMRAEKFDPNGNFLLQFGGAGTPAGSFTFPRGIAISPDGLTIVICDSENHRFQFFTPNGALLRKPLAPTGSTVQRPYQIALGSDGSLWIDDTNRHRILDIDMTGAILQNWTTGPSMTPRGIALDLAGNVYVADTGHSLIQKFTPAGTLLATLSGPGNGPTQNRGAAGLAIAGPSGSEVLYIADTMNNRIVEMTTAGAAVTTFGTQGSGPGQMSHPEGVAVGPTGQIAVADYDNNRISLWQS